MDETKLKEGLGANVRTGFVGDGFARGVGCLKWIATGLALVCLIGLHYKLIHLKVAIIIESNSVSWTTCIKNGVEANGTIAALKDRGKKVSILAGVVGPVFNIASIIALFCLLKRPDKSSAYDLDQALFHGTISFRKACRTRLFTYQELEEATKGFEDSQKLVHSRNGIIYAGVLGDGSHVAVHKVQFQDQRDLMQVLSRIEVLSAVSHRNMARLLGCCIDSSYTPLVVYEYPGNGTLVEHLGQSRGLKKIGLDWYKRMNIAAEIACSKNKDLPAVAMQNIRNGKLEEIVDPGIYYHEQPPLRRKQIEIVADIADACRLVEMAKLG
ncbi:probably inactive receptor-like protein kinase At2g46850 [Hevea brasiliensis]|uniref:probably inactive receptor-like protein kinase At2g46850 n=1 Tax=Hevea brasiliensis TaxID=3981 RepID=UPI0025F9F523|nr:probably inactive receptor-like protein kinase At2g46850 [Hevea brasiliensis]